MDKGLEVSLAIKPDNILLTKRHNSVNLRMDREISTLENIVSDFILVPFLSDDDITSSCNLSTEEFHTTVFCFGVG